VKKKPGCELLHDCANLRLYLESAAFRWLLSLGQKPKPSLERCPSGLRCRPGKSVWAYTPPRVRISPAPPLFLNRRFFRRIERGVPDGPAKVKLPRKETISNQSSSQVRHRFRHDFDGRLSVADTSKLLGVSISTVGRWCEDGKIPAIAKPYGKKVRFLIPVAAIPIIEKMIEDARNVPQTSARNTRAHPEFFDAWVEAMRKGLMTGKPFSDSTLEMYTYYTKRFLEAHPILSSDTLQESLLRTEPSEYCKRFKLYKSLVCFGKYLIAQGMLDKTFLEEVKPLYPKRHTPPKRLVVDEKQLGQLLAAAKTPFHKMMLTFLGGTGLRVSEAVALKRNDVDFEKQTLIVRLGKGNKTRPLGLSQSVIQAMAKHYEAVASVWVFSDEEGKQLTRSALYHRLRLIGQRAGVKVSPHALRRAFVTLNANKGRPLPMLQKACGHADIRTTMGYCMTSEQEVVDAMKGWD
jgi:integrase/recombinase XerD